MGLFVLSNPTPASFLQPFSLVPARQRLLRQPDSGACGTGDKRWDALLNGLKQSAENNNLHLIICNTDLIESIEDEEELINEQLQNNVDAFVICPALCKEIIYRTTFAH